MKKISKLQIVLLITIAHISLASAIEFKAQQINGKTVYTNVPKKCIRDGVVVCHATNSSPKNKQISDRQNKLPTPRASSIPGSIRDQIKKDAKDEWPGNFRMQEYVIKKQEDSYKVIINYKHRGVPRSVIDKIKQQASKEWGSNYRMRLYVINKQAKSYLAVNGR